MKAVIATLLGLVLLGSPVMAERIPVEGWYKKVSDEYGKSWKDSGKRTHFHSIKRFGEVSIFGEGFGFKGKSESEFSLTILDDNLSGSIVAKFNWISEKNPLSGFAGHSRCEITAGSTVCVMWFDGYGEFEGKILELSLNEKEQIDKEDASGFDLYMLEGLVMNEPK
jgi:hypothetical protein